MGTINIFSEKDEEFTKICESYPECIGCPRAGGRPFVTENGLTYTCETGKNKTKDEAENK